MYFEGLTNYGVKEITNQGNELYDDYILKERGIKSHDELDYIAYTGNFICRMKQYLNISSP